MSGQIEHIAKVMILAGVVLAAAGIVLLLLRHTGLPLPGRLPGDIVIEKKNFSFYFPVATSIIISIILSIIFYFINRR